MIKKIKEMFTYKLFLKNKLLEKKLRENLTNYHKAILKNNYKSLMIQYKLITRINKLKKENNKYKKISENRFKAIKSLEKKLTIENKKDYSLKVLKPNFFKRLFSKDIKRLILYSYNDGNGDLIKDYSNNPIFEKDKNKRHHLNKPLCYIKGVPFYFLHENIIINLERKDEILRWNPVYLYNAIVFQIKKKLTQGEQTNLIDELKKNWLIILIIIAVVIFFSTPYGQNLIQQLMKDINLNK